MKTNPSLMMVVALLACATTSAQETSDNNLAPPPSPPAASRPVSSSARGTPAAAPPRPRVTEPLRRNIVLHIQGTAFGGLPVDVQYTGSGPVFLSNYVLTTFSLNNSERPVLGQVQADLNEVAGGYQAFISVGARVPTITSTTAASSSESGRASAPTSTITYMAAKSESTILLKPGVPVVFLNANGETLTAILVENPGVVAPATTSPTSLGENLKLTVHVVNADGTSLDMSTVTDKRQVTLNPVVGETALSGTRQPRTASFTAMFAPFPGSVYRIEYNLGQNIEVANNTSASANSSNVSRPVSYQSITQRGATFLKPGESATVFQSGKQEITLRIEKNATGALPSSNSP